MFNGVGGVLTDNFIGVLIESLVSFINVILPVHNYHSYPLICCEDYAVPVPFKFP